MKENKENRALLFADIVGYTALMQDSEDEGLRVLAEFKQIINTALEYHSGEVIQYIGDAAFITFSDLNSGIRAGLSMQTGFRNAQIPVRIGMHISEVSIKDGDVYGDGVNLASRIESMSVPGGIFVSEDVIKQLGKDSELIFESLGHFHFKNIKRSREIFALAYTGFVMPKRSELKGKFKENKSSSISSWALTILLGMIALGIYYYWKNTQRPAKEILDKRLSVMVFDNQTNDPELDAFGMMVSDWVTNGLIDLGEPNVVNAANLLQSSIGISTQDKRDILVRDGGVDVVLDGRYYSLENKMILQSNFVDARTGKVLYSIDPIEGNKDQLKEILRQFTVKVLNFWNVRDKNLYLDYPPDIEAYKNYVDAGNYTITDPIKSEKLYRAAYQADTHFFAPLFALRNLYEKEGKDSLKREVIAHLEKRKDRFSKYESLRYQEWQAEAEQDWLGYGQIAEKIYRIDPSVDGSLSNIMTAYGRANYIDKAKEFLHEFEQRNLEKEEELPFWWYAYRVYFELQLGNYVKVDSIAQSYQGAVIPDAMVVMHCLSLVEAGQLDLLFNVLAEYHNKNVLSITGQPSDMISAYILSGGLLHSLELSDVVTEILPTLDSLTEVHREKDSYAENKGYVHFYKGEYQLAIDQWTKEKFNNINWPPLFRKARQADQISRIGSAMALSNDIESARAQLAKIESIEETDKAIIGIKLYYKARILAHLGQAEDALTSLEESVNNGFHFFGPMRFQYDPFLKPVRNEPRFIHLIKPKI